MKSTFGMGWEYVWFCHKIKWRVWKKNFTLFGLWDYHQNSIVSGVCLVVRYKDIGKNF